jgi:ribosomal protein S18 acetylase RimI-like enzyme
MVDLEAQGPIWSFSSLHGLENDDFRLIFMLLHSKWEIFTSRRPIPMGSLNPHSSCSNIQKITWGSDMKQKERVFLHDDSRFIVPAATATFSSFIQEMDAFAMFRFEVDEDTHEKILYVYELQVKSESRRLGLWKRLMILLEMIAMQTRMNKVMLTVFTFNQSALSFYRNKMKYRIDPSSPSNFDKNVEGQEEEEQESADYEILSKVIGK